jgi:hypothetical protein
MAMIHEDACEAVELLASELYSTVTKMSHPHSFFPDMGMTSYHQCFFYDFLFFAQVAPLKHILKPIHPDVG